MGVFCLIKQLVALLHSRQMMCCTVTPVLALCLQCSSFVFSVTSVMLSKQRPVSEVSITIIFCLVKTAGFFFLLQFLAGDLLHNKTFTCTLFMAHFVYGALCFWHTTFFFYPCAAQETKTSKWSFHHHHLLHKIDLYLHFVCCTVLLISSVVGEHYYCLHKSYGKIPFCTMQLFLISRVSVFQYLVSINK